MIKYDCVLLIAPDCGDNHLICRNHPAAATAHDFVFDINYMRRDVVFLSLDLSPL